MDSESQLHMVDVVLANCWLEYRNDCQKYDVFPQNTMSLLDFRLAVAEVLSAPPKRKRSGSSKESSRSSNGIETTSQVAKLPRIDKRLDGSEHWPTVDNLQIAQACRFQGCTSHSQTRCEKCKVYLCLTSQRNCFKKFDTRP